MKRLTCWILMVVLLLTAIPAMAADTRTSGLFTYEIKGNGTITITDFDWNRNDGDIYIPNMIDGYTITAIGDSAFSVEKYNAKAPKVIVVLPNSITTIGEKAFMNASVSTISIPANTKVIGKGAFANCPITQFSVAPDNAVFATIDGVLYNKTNKTLIAFPGSKDISNGIVIPEGITAIDDYAFYYSYRDDRQNIVYGIEWPSTLKSIGNYAFYGRFFTEEYVSATALSPYDHNYDLIPDSIETLGEYAFANCTFDLPKESNITSSYVISLGNAQRIGIGCFQSVEIDNDKCSATYTISVGERVSTIPEFVFAEFEASEPYEGKEIMTIQLPKSLRNVGDSAFENSLPVKGINLTAIAEMGVNAFANTGFYQGTLTIPGSLQTIPQGAFIGLKSRNVYDSFWTNEDEMPKTIILEEGIEAIEAGAFSGQSELTSVQLCSTLTEIGANAFAGCAKLTSITLPASVDTIGEKAFERTIITLVVEEGSYSAIWAQENGYNYKYVGQNDEDLSWLTGGSETEGTTEDTSWLNN